MHEQQLPNSFADEKAAIGSLLVDPSRIVDVADRLRPEHFYHVRNQDVYQAMIDLFNRAEPIDSLTLANQLIKSGKTSHGKTQLDIMLSVSDFTAELNRFDALNLMQYTAIILDLATRRDLIRAAGEVAKLAWNQEAELKTVSGSSEQLIFNVTQRNEPTKAQHIGNVARDLLSHSEHMNEIGHNAVSVATGFIDIDRVLDPGFTAPDLVMLAARPGMGKTSLLLGMAENMATAGKKVALFNLEMTALQVTARIISSHTKLGYKAIVNGRLADHEWGIYHREVARLAQLPIYIEDVSTLTPSMIRAKTRRIAIEHGLDAVMIDYIQLMDSDTNWGVNRVQAVSEISRNLKMLAKELEVPVIAAAQLSRAVESRGDKRPMLSDLRDSGSLEQDSDIVMFIYRDEYYNPDTTDRPCIAEIDFAKHRNGSTCSVDLRWNGDTASFQNLYEWDHVRN